jgi:hypothetical protein
VSPVGRSLAKPVRPCGAADTLWRGHRSVSRFFPAGLAPARHDGSIRTILLRGRAVQHTDPDRHDSPSRLKV